MKITNLLKEINNNYKSFVFLDESEIFKEANLLDLYSKAKRTFDKYPTSAVCMFKITNIEEINEKAGRLYYRTHRKRRRKNRNNCRYTELERT